MAIFLATNAATQTAQLSVHDESQQHNTILRSIDDLSDVISEHLDGDEQQQSVIQRKKGFWNRFKNVYHLVAKGCLKLLKPKEDSIWGRFYGKVEVKLEEWDIGWGWFYCFPIGIGIAVVGGVAVLLGAAKAVVFKAGVCALAIAAPPAAIAYGIYRLLAPHIGKVPAAMVAGGVFLFLYIGGLALVSKVVKKYVGKRKAAKNAKEVEKKQTLVPKDLKGAFNQFLSFFKGEKMKKISKKKKKTLKVLLGTVLAVLGLGGGGWFGYRILVKKTRERENRYLFDDGMMVQLSNCSPQPVEQESRFQVTEELQLAESNLLSAITSVSYPALALSSSLSYQSGTNAIRNQIKRVNTESVVVALDGDIMWENDPKRLEELKKFRDEVKANAGYERGINTDNLQDRLNVLGVVVNQEEDLESDLETVEDAEQLQPLIQEVAQNTIPFQEQPQQEVVENTYQKIEQETQSNFLLRQQPLVLNQEQRLLMKQAAQKQREQKR